LAFTAEIDGVLQVIIVVVVCGPKDGLVTLLDEALWWYFKFRNAAGLRLADNHSARCGRRSRRKPQGGGRCGSRGQRGLSLRSHARVLNQDSVDHRCDILRLVRQRDPFDAVARPAIVNDGFPLREARRRYCGFRSARRVGPIPPGPLLAWILGVARSNVKF